MPGLPQISPESLWRRWNVWQLPLRFGVLLSLSLQIVLIIYGNRRKYWRKRGWIIFLWISYLLADGLATVSLGILSRKDPKDESLETTNDAMTALWAPILLVHLGSPDTITGYSLEDNQLWHRYFLGLISQILLACYVTSKSWNTSPLNFIAIPVFVAALVKCGERTWALMSASREHFRDLVLPDPDPGPNYAKFMDEYCSKIREGYEVSTRTVPKEASVVPLSWPLSKEASVVPLPWPLPLQLQQKVTDNIQDAQVVCDAHYVFNVFKSIFGEVIPILSILDQDNSLDYFTKKLWDQACKVPSLQDDNSRKLYHVRTAFRIIEVELGFLYDFLHTKTTLFYSYWPWSAFFRIVGILSTVSAFFAFYIIDKRKYFRIEVFITYVLLAVAVALELYAVIILLSSDWAMLWLCKLKMMSPKGEMIWIRKLEMVMGLPIYKIISVLRWCHIVPANKRWSNSMSQLNLISICLKEKPAWWPWFQKVHIYERLENLRYEYIADVSDSLKKLIYDRLEEEATSDSGKKKVWTHRGDQAPEVKHILQNAAFDQSILLWHIATTLCYPDYDRKNKDISESDQPRVISMKLSNYLFDLLITSPFMLPSGIGLIRYRDTRAEASDFLKERKKFIKESAGTRVEAACERLLAVSTEIEPSEVKGDQSKSVLFDACRLAKSLHNPETGTYKWDIISRAWVEMLAYAASRCAWNNHARKLAEGGELLTHVWLLMVHLGITEHFQISEGYANAKLGAI